MKTVAVAIGVIRHQDRCFLQRRDPGCAWLPGLWEFPGGKLEPGETPLQALGRELREELAWVPEQAQALAPVRHRYPGRAVQLHPFLCQGPMPVRSTLAWGWFTLTEMERLAKPEANHAVVFLLLKKLRHSRLGLDL